MGIKQSLKRGRKLDEAIMTDTCEITRPGDGFEIDPETGSEIPVSETVYSGKCRLASSPQSGEHLDSTHHRYLIEAPRLHLPHDAQVQSGDDAVITATETGNVSIGISMRLVDLNRGTYRTSQRWNVEVVSG